MSCLADPKELLFLLCLVVVVGWRWWGMWRSRVVVGGGVGEWGGGVGWIGKRIMAARMLRIDRNRH